MSAEVLALVLLLVAVIIIGIWTLDRARSADRDGGRAGYPGGSVSQPLDAVRSSDSGSFGDASKSGADGQGPSHPLAVREIPAADRARFSKEWRSIQLSFVGDPATTFRDANRLVHTVIEASGLPPTDFERRADEIENSFPDFVRHYRAAEVTVHANERGEASIDDLRQGMVHYKAVFRELLGSTSDSGQFRAV